MMSASNMGFGANAGLGLGFAISEGTRMRLTGTYGIRIVESQNYGLISINAGFLF